MSEEQKLEGLPVPGYTAQPQSAVAQVTANKHHEERLLRLLDMLKGLEHIEQRWLSIARTHIEQAFMALNRAVFKPARVQLPEDKPAADTSVTTDKPSA